MKLLGIDSSGLAASVCLMFDGVMIAEYTTNFKKTHSQTLLPMVDAIVSMTGIQLSELDAIAVAGGPGSFTGLRIGSATAKGLGLALKKPVISVPTVEAIACNLYETNKLICPLMDARRGQVYTGLYAWREGVFQIVRDQRAVGLLEILEECRLLSGEYPSGVIFLGDGVAPYKEQIEERCQVEHVYAPAHLAMQRAGALCWRAKHYMALGKAEPAAEHRPDYLRLSQAERERNEKIKTANAALKQ